MPQVPIQNNFGVLPEVAQHPRLSAENFGAGVWKQIGENANTMAKGAEAMENIKYFSDRQKARDAMNDFDIKMAQSQADMIAGNIKDAQGNPVNPFSQDKNGNYAFQATLQKTYNDAVGAFRQQNQNDPFLVKAFGEMSERSYRQAMTKMTLQGAEVTKRNYMRSLEDSYSIGLVTGDGDKVKAANELAQWNGWSNDQLQEFKDRAGINAINKSANQNLPQVLQNIKGQVSDGAYDKLSEEVDRRTKTADGRIASADSKDRLGDIKLMAQEDTSKLASLSEDYFKGMTAADEAQAREHWTKARQGIPQNPDEVMMGKIILSHKGDKGNLDPTQVSAWTGDNLSRQIWCRNVMNTLPADKRTPENLQKIYDQSEKPTLFFDQNNAKIDKAYKATQATQLKEDTGWWQRRDFPKGTVPMEAYNGQEGSFAAIPIGHNRYQIYNLDKKQNVGTATEKELNGNAE